MRYALLISAEENAVVSSPERSRRAAAFTSVQEEMRASGVLLASERLHPTDTATTVRCWDGGDVVIADGPFAETKEQIAGFFIVDCKDLDEVIEVAGMTRKPAPQPDPGQPGSFLPNQARAKAGLSRGILASAWGVLGQRIKDKGETSGVLVLFVDPRLTSQQCHACGHTDPANRDSQAVFACVSCGHQDHADRNAALNILARGLLLTAGGLVSAHAAGHAAPRPHQPAPAAAGTTQAA